MLTGLYIENIVLIKQLNLDIQPGLTVLTGETGAGKSILLDALYLALGERADINLIRADETQATVTACFYVKDSHILHEVIDPLGIKIEDNTLILRRHILKEGSSRAYINDKPVTLSTLKTLVSFLLTIHAQFDRLLDPHSHQSIIDNYGHHDIPLKEVEHAFMEWQTAEKDLAHSMASSHEKVQRLAFLTMALDDLKVLDYKPEEELTLQQNRSTAFNLTKLQDLARTTHSRLYGSPSVDTGLTEALVCLDKIHQLSPDLFKPLSLFLERCHLELQEYEANLQEFCTSSHVFDLEAIDQRLYDLKAMARKYGVEIKELATLYDAFHLEQEKLQDMAFGTAALTDKALELKALFEKKALHLRQLRYQVAKELQTHLDHELKALNLNHASVRFDFVDLPPEQWTKRGMERITLWVKMNEGSTWGPLAKVASGGERSRLMLALKIVLNEKALDFTQIFDEIDAGMSGAAAAAVGQALKKLSKQQQVISISHAPQVAAVADHHWYISKEDKNGQTTTTVQVLKEHERVEEVARLLSGNKITLAAKLAAQSLIDQE